jgi:hypothetical protein
MPAWKVTPEWINEDVHIIGGGSSLLGFDFSKLESKRVIGCNDAFNLGPQVVDVCLFGDTSWWQKNKWELEKFKGRVASVSTGTVNFQLPWMLQLTRAETPGLHRPPLLGWNYSTGAAAINLALQLGARRVFLLGFDLCRKEEKTHWHKKRDKLTTDVSFLRFLNGFKRLAEDLTMFPEASLCNVTDDDPRLPTKYFPKVSFSTYEEEVLS